MKHPQRWRDCMDPHELPLRRFAVREVLGYPHAGNDVFQVTGIYGGQEVEAYIKVARQQGADLRNEIQTIQALNNSLCPQILDYDERDWSFVVTLAKPGERLSAIVGENSRMESMDYLYEYGRTLANLHQAKGSFAPVKDRRFFHLPDEELLRKNRLEFVWQYLCSHQPKTVNRCFCHGDFHYANLLWQNGHVSAILDFELSGIGNREFDAAWAVILRPGQKFLKTPQEVELFVQGYQSLEKLDYEAFCYYMVLIYSHFYQIGEDEPEYQQTVREILRRLCAQSGGLAE